MATTTLQLSTGDQIEVEGSVEDVAKALENATRSSAGTLVWVRATVVGDDVGVNPAHVVSVRPARL